MRPGRSFGFLLVAAAISASAQSPAPPDLIDQLVANAEQYRASLPSLTADEAIDSRSSYRSIFVSHAKAEGTFRVLRADSDDPLKESRQITILNGSPVEPGQTTRLPATLFGGFDGFQAMFFTPQHRPCYTFTLLPESGPGKTLQITIASPEPTADHPACASDPGQLTGVALVDPATHQIVHLERTIPDDIANRANLAPFASVDLAPTRVGDQIFWLPTTVTGRILNGKIRGEFIAHYSNYHRYTASITLLPGATEVKATPDPAPRRLSRHRTEPSI